MQTVVFPFQKTSAGNYQNNFGEFHLDSLKHKEDYDFFLSEGRSGEFKLVDTGAKVPKANSIKAICPHHCMQELVATDNHTLVCKQCDPRLV